MEYELKKSGIEYISEIVQNEAAYSNALRNFIKDVILSDYSLPLFDGAKAFQIKEQVAPDTPFLFQGILEIPGGKISITSEVNKGTEFKIEFEI